MTLFSAALLGIIEGVTEFLPVSSTAHLILAEKIMNIPVTPNVGTFDIAIQLGAIAAVAVVSGRSLKKSWRFFWLTVAAFIPTGLIGFLLHGYVKTYLLADVTLILWTLSLGGIVLILFEMLLKRTPRLTRIDDFSFPLAVTIGFFQAIAIIPGISRSAATIIGGMMLGTDRRSIVEFSFLLAIPTMIAATGYDLYKSAAFISSQDMLAILIGFCFAFVTAYISLKWLLHFVKTHTFIPFGIERIAAAALVWMLV
ncbi:hypothetical protein A3C52_01160 [Candidatus Peribacteria bacterium RIFCSPHIGHO2_02_FULL_51_15]|nr:MAG: hypothetical protein A3C52_01160 [Candidatus Peribacteria bacterium RIFCSPHIGHO2_02_FULL_51_15]